MFLIFIFLLFAGAGEAVAQTSEPTIMQKVFLAKQVFPDAKTVGVLCNTQTSTELLRALKIAGDAYQLQIRVFDARDLKELRVNFERMVHSGNIDLVWIIPDDVANQKFGRRFLAEKCIALKIPLFVPSVEYLREGALFTVSTDVDNASKIFVNRKVQEMMGLTFPPERQAKIIAIEY
jgi:ABC-type uncharacterized transport system substrate-binding protein